jgi:cytochrome c oxidase subunit 2
MQMKIIVDSPEDYKAWLKGNPTIVQQVKEANAPKVQDASTEIDSTKAKDTTAISKMAMK